MSADNIILVVLAAANRDLALNPNPKAFDLFRPAQRALTFGIGPHLCSGEAIAVAIATAGVTALVAANIDFESLTTGMTYRTSANTRIPVFYN